MRKVLVLVALVLAGVLAWWWSGEPAKPQADRAGPHPERRSAIASRALPPVAASVKRGELTIVGTVSGPKGPIGGVTITAVVPAAEGLAQVACPCPRAHDAHLADHDCGCASSVDELFRAADERRGEAEPVAATTSEADGHFELTGLGTARVAVWADSEELGSTRVEGIEPGATDVRLELGHGFAIRGSVRDTDDEPLARAEVVVVSAALGRSFAAATDAAGRFRVPPIPPGELVVAARAEGFEPDRLAIDGSDRTASFRLSKVRAVTVLVTQDRRPVAGALVQADDVEAGRTAADGTLALTGVSGVARVSAHDATTGAAGEGYVGNNDEEELEVELRPTGTLDGVVNDPEGQPIADAEVRLRGREAMTADDGTFSFARVPAEAQRPYASAKGWFPPEREARPFVKVNAGETAHVALVLERASLLVGRVLAPDGKPVEGAEVTALDRRSRGREIGTTDAQGRFSLEVRTGDFGLTARHDRYRPAKGSATVPGQAVELQMEGGWSVRGDVVDARGMPLESASLALVSISDLEERRMDDLKQATTDQSGAFLFEGVADGTYRLILEPSRVGLDDGAPSGSLSTSVTVNGADPPPLHVTLDSGLSIRGRVVDDAGQPIASATVRANALRREAGTAEALLDSMSMGSARSGEDGTFEIAGLKALEHDLVASAEAHDSADKSPLRATPGGSPITITLHQSHFARGRVVDPAGAPVRGFRVNGDRFHAADGSFAASLDPMRFHYGKQLVITAQPYPPLLVPLERGADADVELGELKLEAGRTVTLTIVEAGTGRPIEGAQVQASSVVPLASTAASTATGVVVLEHAPIAEFSARVYLDTHLLAQAKIAAGTDELRIELAQGRFLTGRVLSASGAPLAHVEVLGTAQERGFVSTESGPDGAYRLGPCRPGQYELLVNASQAAQAFFRRVEVDVPADADVSLDLHAEAGVKLTARVTRDAGKPAALVSGLLVEGSATLPATREAWTETGRRTIARASSRENEGQLVFPIVPPGRYTLFVLAPIGFNGMGVHAQPVNVTGPQVVDVRLPATLTPLP